MTKITHKNISESKNYKPLPPPPAKAKKGRDEKGKFIEGNVSSIGNNGGREPLYDNPNELEEKVLEYFEWLKGEYEERQGTRTYKENQGGKLNTVTETFTYKFWIREPETPSITGLAIFLGFASRKSMYDYVSKPEFSYSIKKALLKVENNYEKGLLSDKCTGVIFALKNMGWSDKTETEITGNKEKPLEHNFTTKVIFEDYSKPKTENE